MKDMRDDGKPFRVLGVVTARGGSKGIPGKNVKPLAGKPLIRWTIEAAQRSGALDRLILSTDDEKIAQAARAAGCEVPFLRPAELAQDTTPHLPVMQHAVRWMEEHEGYRPDAVLILQPTSPFRQPFHISDSVARLVQTGADAVVSVARIPIHYHPLKAMLTDADGMLALVDGRPIRSRTPRRQDLPSAYWSAGLIFLFRREVLFAPEPSLYGDRVASYEIEDRYLTDLDEPNDWIAAEQAAHAFLGAH